ncbi:MAG TPA: carboxypeptidase-like regulatory domain-containing protein [Pyrinomonadaceae bacterium]|nr:carboxypeptidase-like regulatory domain-containing protein [Pyrinomonadaceae bacterium]
MRKLIKGFGTMLLLTVFSQIAVQAQSSTGAIAGTVVDQNGSVVPGASVAARGTAGQEYTVTTSANGTYRIPAVANGFYTVTITATGFKTTVRTNVKVDVGVPATVDATLEVGDISQVVEVTSGGEILQTQTATVSNTIVGRQITETPLTSRDALDLITLLPGTSTTGAPRRSTINGLPKGAISITIDGVDVQDNYLRSSDGFFTYVRPRVDAIEEVTLTSAVPGAESSGDGAVGIRFVTRRGTNDYRGGLFWQHRNTDLNANYWYNNRNGLERQRVLLNQFGGRFGGPIPFFNFGEGVPMFHSGKDRAFFFVNYEEFRYPESLTRTRTILTQEAQSGVYRYISGGQVRSVNLYNLALANSLPNTPDPTINALLASIRSTTNQGTVRDITNAAGAITDYNRQTFSFTNPGNQKRTFLALRFDVNLTKKHSLENVTNYQKFNSFPDFLNSMDPAFPGFTNTGGQYSTRPSNTTALRSNFTNNIVNEARFNVSGGDSSFAPEFTRDLYANTGGYALSLSTAFSLTNAHVRNSKSGRTSPVREFTDSLTWLKGNHTISVGGQFKRIGFEDYATNFIVPTIYFSGIAATDTQAFNMFNATTLPGASAAQLTEARQLYAVLTGRITQVDFWAEQTPAGNYDVLNETGNKVRQDTFGLFAQDSWRMRPNLTVNFGLRWQPQTSYIPLSKNYGRLSSFDDVYGISGPGNMFKPGTMTGKVPTIVRVEPGEKASPTDYNNFAPSVGAVWSPGFDKGFLGGLFGGSGRSVFRGGYSKAFVREGTLLLLNLLGSNPGGSRIDLRRHASFLNLTPGSLLRDPNNPNLVPGTFPASPSFPYTVTQNAGINAFDPDLKTGYVDSWTFGYQREIDRNTVVEARYVGNRGRDLWVQHNINELNTIENGFAAEFAKAQGNLYANIAAGQANQGFRYTGNPGTQPLPIFIAWLNSTANNQPNNTAVYTNAFFTNSSNIALLSRNNPNVLSMAATLENFAGARANALANNVPANFFYANPTSASGGAFVLNNGEKSWYDAAVFEVRRRLSDGLRVNASYVWAKAFTNAYATSAGNDQVNFVGMTFRNPDLQKTTAQHDIRHAFKFDATYDFPFGKGRQFFSNSNWFVNSILGGWTIAPVIRWQSGSPIVMQNVQLIGMTRDELQKEIKVRKGPNAVTFLPDDIILNTQRAYNIDVFSATGYGTTFGGAPEGRFIAPAGYGNCQARYAGECGFSNLVLYGPNFFKFDASLIKRIRFDEKRNFELKASFFDLLNKPNFRVGGWGADTVILGGGGATFGQLGSGAAYQDVSTTNDPGGRIVEFMLRFNF